MRSASGAGTSPCSIAEQAAQQLLRRRRSPALSRSVMRWSACSTAPCRRAELGRARGRDVERVRAPVGRVASPLDEPAALQLVGDADHQRAVDVQALGEPLL